MIASLVEIAVQENKKRWPPFRGGYSCLLIRCHAPRLSAWRPSSAVYQLPVVPGPAPKFSCRAIEPRVSVAPGKGIVEKEKDTPPVFLARRKDWPWFKEAIQDMYPLPHTDMYPPPHTEEAIQTGTNSHDNQDTMWLFEGGQKLALFFSRQIKDKIGTTAARKKALERKIGAKADSNHVPTSIDANPSPRPLGALDAENP